MIKNFIKYPISRTARKKVRNYLKEKQMNNIKLIMTLLVKNEEDILETNIRFHKEMGIDGFIVTSHNSTDRTNEILEQLKQEGLVLEIIYETIPEYKQDLFVDRMIKLAKKKYHADWIINADADEFYYSKDLNFKKTLFKYNKTNINVLMVDSTFLFPDDRDDFLNCPYFVTKPFQEFEAEMLNIKQDNNMQLFIGSQGCTKVIHKTKNYKKIAMGNHSVKIKFQKQINSSEISLYHYHVKNYNETTKKITRYIDSAKYMPNGQGNHIKKMIEDYNNGLYREKYNSQYNENIRNFLLNEGVVSIDKSISNFIKWKGITNKYD